MAHLLLHCAPSATQGPCGLCGRPTAAPAGPQLVLVEGLAPVCGDCGRRDAPALAALAGLADAAERISRVGRQGVFPPLTALLELAGAAEKYTGTAPPRLRDAG